LVIYKDFPVNFIPHAWEKCQIFSSRHDVSTQLNLLIQLNTKKYLIVMIPNDVDITDIQFRVTRGGTQLQKKHCLLEGFQALRVDPSGKIKKSANKKSGQRFCVCWFSPGSATEYQAFPSSLVWSSCSLLTAFHSMKSLSDKQRELRTSLQVYLCIVTSLQTCLSPQRELFSPHPFTLRISKTDMQHSITVFSQTCLIHSHTLSLPLCFTVFSIKESRDTRSETSWL